MTPPPTHTRTRSAEAFTLLILETFRLNGRLLAAGDRLTKSLGLSSALWQVLGAIETAPATMAQIARNMGLSRQSVRRTVTVLTDKGFVELKNNPDHQRAKLVALAPRGRAVLIQTSAMQVEWSNDIAADVNPEELEKAVDLLQMLSQRL